MHRTLPALDFLNIWSLLHNIMSAVIGFLNFLTVLEFIYNDNLYTKKAISDPMTGLKLSS
jgi:hypothetical protein